MADSPQTQVTPRPSIKIRTPLPTQGAMTSGSPVQNSANAMSPPPNTPLSGTPGAAIPPKKSIIKLTKRSPSVSVPPVPILPGPAPAPPPDTAPPAVLTKTAKGRISKPSAKKRAKTEVDLPIFGSSDHAKSRFIKVKKTSGKDRGVRTASIVVKPVHRGELPVRSKGEGYDSAEEDPNERERDPVIEEQFILRMQPGEHLDYLRKMIDERKIGLPVKDGGADFELRWLVSNDRRALIKIKEARFAAVLVDLPTITESMKTWDRKNFMKSADVCQMLLVFARVSGEAEAKAIELPKMVNKEFRWPHGLTPPMHDCVHRRFRTRLSKKEIKDKEAELKRLLDEDEEAVETSYEWVDDGAERQVQSGHVANGLIEEVDGEEDAEGEDEYMEDDENEVMTLEALLAEELADKMDGEEGEDGDDGVIMAETPAADNGATPVTGEVATPAPASEAGSVATGEASESEEDEDDDDDDSDGDEKRGIRKDISDLKKQLESAKAQQSTTSNLLLKKRIDENIKKIKEELRLKMTNIGEVEDE